MDSERALRFFVTVAKTAHFGHAADLLGITQPPLSQGIKRLEDRLGHPLFVRSARGVQLTAVGQALLEPAQAVVGSADAFWAAAGSVGRPSATFSLGLSDRLPEAALAAAAVVPRLTITTGTSAALTTALRRGELALAVIEHPTPMPEMNGGRIIQIPTVVASLTPVPRLIDLRGETLLTPPRSAAPAAHDLLIDTLTEKAWDGPVRETTTPRDLLGHLLNGSSWAVVPALPAIAPPLVASLAGQLPPLRFRTVWRADCPGEIIKLADDVDTCIREWAADEDR